MALDVLAIEEVDDGGCRMLTDDGPCPNGSVAHVDVKVTAGDDGAVIDDVYDDVAMCLPHARLLLDWVADVAR